eukprot:4391977-Lingulodinium_polyedra.AAC.1
MEALARFPISYTRASQPVTIVGPPPRVADAIGGSIAGPCWANEPRVERCRCRRAFKTQLIPQSDLQAWRRTM